MRHRLWGNWLLLVAVLSGLLDDGEIVFRHWASTCWGQTVSTVAGPSVQRDAMPVRAEDWLITALDGEYSLIDSSRGRLVQLATAVGGESNHAVGDFVFRFPGAVPNGKYRVTVRWRTGVMGGTPWAFLLGSDAGQVREDGISSGKWHYFYPGHNAAHSNQWFTHDLAGPNPVGFSMWPNSPVAPSITVSASDPDQPVPDPEGRPVYVAFDTRVQPQKYPDQPAGFRSTPMVTFGGATSPEGGPTAQHWKAYTAWNRDAAPGKELLEFAGVGTTTLDHALPPGDYIVHADWSANSWNNGDWVALKFSGTGVSEHGSDDPGGFHRIYPPATRGEPVQSDELIGPSMGRGSLALTAGKKPSHFPTGNRFGGSHFGTHLTLAADNRLTFTVHDSNKNGRGNVFFYGLTFIPASFPHRGRVSEVGPGQFYVRLRDMSPGKNNALSIESISLVPLDGERDKAAGSSAALTVETTRRSPPGKSRLRTTAESPALQVPPRVSASAFPRAPVGERFTIGVYYAMPALNPKDHFSWDYAFMDMARSGCNFVVISGNCWANQWAAIKHWGMRGVTSYGELNAYRGPGTWKSEDFLPGIKESRERVKALVWKDEYVGDAVVGHIMDDEPECRGLTDDKRAFLRAWADVYHQHNPQRSIYVNHCDPKWYDLNERQATCSTAPTIAVNSHRIADRIKAARSLGLRNFTVVALLGRLSDWSGQRPEMIGSWGMGQGTAQVFNWLASRTNYQDAYEQMVTAYCCGSLGFHPYIYNQHRAVSLVDKNGNGQYGIRQGFSDAAHDLRRVQGWPGVTLLNNGSPFQDRGTYLPGTFTLTARPEPNGSAIAKIVFGKSSDGGSTWETLEDTDSPFTAQFAAKAGQTLIFRARAVDAVGKTSLYAANMITVQSDP